MWFYEPLDFCFWPHNFYVILSQTSWTWFSLGLSSMGSVCVWYIESQLRIISLAVLQLQLQKCLCRVHWAIFSYFLLFPGRNGQMGPWKAWRLVEEQQLTYAGEKGIFRSLVYGPRNKQEQLWQKEYTIKEPWSPQT